MLTVVRHPDGRFGFLVCKDLEDADEDIVHTETHHTNTCKNRHSFLRQWLAKFRGVWKHHLQRYLHFLELRLISPDERFEKLLCDDVSK